MTELVGNSLIKGFSEFIDGAVLEMFFCHIIFEPPVIIHTSEMMQTYILKVLIDIPFHEKLKSIDQ